MSVNVVTTGAKVLGVKGEAGGLSPDGSGSNAVISGGGKSPGIPLPVASPGVPLPVASPGIGPTSAVTASSLHMTVSGATSPLRISSSISLIGVQIAFGSFGSGV